MRTRKVPNNLSSRPKITYVLSIAVRENCLNWALHQGSRQSFYLPVIFWKTRRVQASDVSNIDTTSTLSPHLHHPLSRFLTRFVNNNIFGNSSRCGSGKSKEKNLNSKNTLKVYVVAPIGENWQVTLIRKLWKNISSQILVLAKDDFLDKEEMSELPPSLKDLKPDCLAALRGSSYLHGYPSLVFDFGRKMTSYVAADRNGCIIGQGVMLGLDSKLRAWEMCNDGSLSKHEALSSSDNFLARAVRMIESKNMASMFTGDSADIVVAEIMGEVKAKVLNVIEEWVNSFDDDDDDDDDDLQTCQPGQNRSARIRRFTNCESNRSRTIVITGEDSPFLIKLLSDDPLVCESIDNDLFKLKHENYVTAHGVSSALLRKARSKEVSTVAETDSPSAILSDYMQKILEKDKKLKDLVGRRVAKKFYAEHSSKCHIYRGTVAAFQPSTVGLDGGMGSGDKETMYFFIKYDDGDREHVKSEELNAMMSLYKSVGEKNGSAKKKNSSKTSATNLVSLPESDARSTKKQSPVQRKGQIQHTL